MSVATNVHNYLNGRANGNAGNGIVLVTGGAGYIGSVLCHELLKAGRRVRVLDSLVFGEKSLHTLLAHPGFELYAEDCTRIEVSIRALKGVSDVVHLAAVVGDRNCDQNRQAAISLNYGATVSLVQAAKELGVSRFVFSSSCSAYGAADTLMDEESQLNPLSVYALSKVAAEHQVLGAATRSFHPTVLRFATVFGLSYRPRFDLVVNSLTANAYFKRAITISNGWQWRPFIHVRDTATAIRSVLDAKPARISGQVLNVGDDRMNYTLDSIAELIRTRQPDIKVDCINGPDARNYRVSFEKIHRRLGFECTVSLEEGIDELRTAFAQGTIDPYAEGVCQPLTFLADEPPSSTAKVKTASAA